jgi:hypothetical protein
VVRIRSVSGKTTCGAQTWLALRCDENSHEMRPGPGSMSTFAPCKITPRCEARAQNQALATPISTPCVEFGEKYVTFHSDEEVSIGPIVCAWFEHTKSMGWFSIPMAAPVSFQHFTPFTRTIDHTYAGRDSIELGTGVRNSRPMTPGRGAVSRKMEPPFFQGDVGQTMIFVSQ